MVRSPGSNSSGSLRGAWGPGGSPARPAPTTRSTAPASRQRLLQLVDHPVLLGIRERGEQREREDPVVDVLGVGEPIGGAEVGEDRMAVERHVVHLDADATSSEAVV